MLRKQMIRVGLITMSLAMLAGSVAAALEAAAPAGWLWDTELRAEHVTNLAANSEPYARGYDCTPTTYRIGTQNQGSPQTGCAIDTMLGSVIPNNNILMNGPNGTLEVKYNPSGFLLPKVPGRSDVLTYTYPPAWASGAVIRVANYEQSRLKFNQVWGLPMQYYYTYDPAGTVELKDATGARIAFDPQTVAYSNNGDWMVVLLDGGGIMLYDTDTWHGKVISWEVGWQYTSAQTKGANLAVSNDGRFVAANPFTGSPSAPQPALKVFDTQTCLDQYAYKSTKTKSNACEYADIWNGTFRGAPFGLSLKAQLAGVEYPRHIRFDGNDVVTFDAVHDRTSATTYSVSRYRVKTTTTPGTPRLGLLGMGDSYISGEGAYYYRSGTDTNNNKCHTSWMSYPYVQGRQYYPTVQSVGCSGAVMGDITDDRPEYQGQVKNKRNWIERSNRDQISSQFIPGNANQLRFTDKYKPQAVLVSIGGNDIGFANIVSRCVSYDTCYSTYESRYQLMQSIVDQYDRLVETYKQITASSKGSRVYVVGYPQVVNPNPVAGACGANVHLNATELKFAANLITYLNTIIKKATIEAGVKFIDTSSALNGKRLCDSNTGAKAVNGITKGDDKYIYIPAVIGVPRLVRVNLIGNESFHPTAAGHKMLGATIATQTNNLSASMPTPIPQSKPQVDANDTLLAGLPRVVPTSDKVIWDAYMQSNPVVLHNESLQIDISNQGFKANTNLQVVINSTPTTLYTGVYDGFTKTIAITIPDIIETGFHELHIYGTNAAGEKVDIRDIVYVDDGTTLNEACGVVPASGLDQDADGKDDACDGDYVDPSYTPEGVADIPTEEPFVEEVIEEPTENEEPSAEPPVSSQDPSVSVEDDASTSAPVVDGNLSPLSPVDSSTASTVLNAGLMQPASIFALSIQNPELNLSNVTLSETSNNQDVLSVNVEAPEVKPRTEVKKIDSLAGEKKLVRWFVLPTLALSIGVASLGVFLIRRRSGIM